MEHDIFHKCPVQKIMLMKIEDGIPFLFVLNINNHSYFQLTSVYAIGMVLGGVRSHEGLVI